VVKKNPVFMEFISWKDVYDAFSKKQPQERSGRCHAKQKSSMAGRRRSSLGGARRGHPVSWHPRERWAWAKAQLDALGNSASRRVSPLLLSLLRGVTLSLGDKYFAFRS
jgi:hypothetical protein